MNGGRRTGTTNGGHLQSQVRTRNDAHLVALLTFLDEHQWRVSTPRIRERGRQSRVVGEGESNEANRSLENQYRQVINIDEQQNSQKPSLELEIV